MKYAMIFVEKLLQELVEHITILGLMFVGMVFIFFAFEGSPFFTGVFMTCLVGLSCYNAYQKMELLKERDRIAQSLADTEVPTAKEEKKTE